MTSSSERSRHFAAFIVAPYRRCSRSFERLARRRPRLGSHLIDPLNRSPRPRPRLGSHLIDALTRSPRPRPRLGSHLIAPLNRSPRRRPRLGSHYHYKARVRDTNFVAIPIFCAAVRNDTRATSSGTPIISYRMRPGFTTATHSSGFPLPLPIRVSAGFFVTGLSGKTRIQTLPPRLRLLESATRAASIWRLVTQPGSRALRPKSPKASVDPRVAMPFIRPRWAFRYLTRFGLSIGGPPHPSAGAVRSISP